MGAQAQNHYIRIRNILIWILVLNWAVALAKIIYGALSRCASMSADGFHSLSDGTSNIICLVGVYLASRPRDFDHPYGHRKYETFFSLGIAALLLILSFNIAKEGLARLYNPITPQINLNGFLIMVITLCVNLAVMSYEYRQGKAMQSDMLIADSMHTRADIFTSLSVIITLAAIKMGYPIIDPIASLVIALFIAYAGLNVVGQSSKILCDTAPIMDVKRISDAVLCVKGVKTCHKIRTRGRPDDINVDLHVQVGAGMHMDKAHQISYEIESAIKKAIPEVTDVVVHMEPQERIKAKGPSK